MVGLVYFNALQADFVFDDRLYVAGTEADGYSPDHRMPHRPVIHWTISLNRALAGDEPAGFHALNIAIHATSVVLLFLLTRAILHANRVENANVHAFCVSLIWAVHPLNTMAVTYVIQRCESLMGAFYLATLLCHAKGVLSGQGRWFMAACLCFWVGSGCKEPIWLAPLVLVAFEWLALRQTVRSIIGRWFVFGAYLLPALALLFQVAPQTAAATTTVGTSSGVTPFQYLTTQSEVITHYIRLGLVPHPLCFDYAWPIATSIGEALPQGLLTVAVFVVTVLGVILRRLWAFAGVWFFLVLAPTSSVMPIQDAAVEYRMYLPVISIVTLLVAVIGLVSDKLASRTTTSSAKIQLTVAIILAIVLGTLTHLRNRDYASEKTLWESIVETAPQNSRAHHNLGVLLDREATQKRDAAILRQAAKHMATAVALRPDRVDYRLNLAAVQLDLGRADEAEVNLRTAFQHRPNHPEVLVNLGVLAASRQQFEDADRWFRMALSVDPDNPSAAAFLNRLQQQRALEKRNQP